MFNAERQEIAKPSELVSSVRAFMSVLQSVDNYVHLDLTRIFNNVLLQQTQPQDPFGDETVATLYTKWYLEVLLRRVSSGHILFSGHQRAFVLHPQAEASLHFNPQEYTDVGELRALSELLGPYGVKYVCERLTWHVASQIGELKKLTLSHKELLRAMRSNFDKPERMKELYKELISAVMGQKGAGDQSQNLLTRLAIVGEILNFRDILQSALSDVLEDRIPFLFSSILDLQKEGPPPDHPELLNSYELFGTAGLKAPIDATLVNALKAQAQQQSQQAAIPPPGEDDYHLSCLLLVFIAECLPKFATLPSGFFKASVGAHLNNAHCIGLAINEIAAALFANQSRGQLEIVDRMKEFLALASGSLLRLVQEPGDRAQLPNLESSYILLDKIVDGSPWLSVDLLESCFPYVLLRSAYHCTYKQEKFHPGA